MKEFSIKVLCGGISSERDVSIVSGGYVSESLSKYYDVEKIILEKNEVPEFIDGGRDIVFPVTHGEYGEDGSLQLELRRRGIEYAGCESLASRVCMNKSAAKALMKEAGLGVAKEILFCGDRKPSIKSLIEYLGEDVVIKPADKGSSVGLLIAKGISEVELSFSGVGEGLWLAEEFWGGREFSIGVIDGVSAGIVEVIAEGGIYDYKRKYTAGSTRYEFPAKLEKVVEDGMRRSAEEAFRVCGCRDFARIDFILRGGNEYIILEINTLPGMTPTSLLPKSVSCIGYDYDMLCKKMVSYAIGRFEGNG